LTDELAHDGARQLIDIVTVIREEQVIGFAEVHMQLPMILADRR